MFGLEKKGSINADGWKAKIGDSASVSVGENKLECHERGVNMGTKRIHIHTALIHVLFSLRDKQVNTVG